MHRKKYGGQCNQHRKIMMDSVNCIEIKEDDVPTVLDIHGCKYFGQLVSNESLPIWQKYKDAKNIRFDKKNNFNTK